MSPRKKAEPAKEERPWIQIDYVFAILDGTTAEQLQASREIRRQLNESRGSEK